MCEITTSVESVIRSVPETMIRSYGHFDTVSMFKLNHNGETFRLPHYNFKIHDYFLLYTEYLKMLMGTSLNISIFHVDDPKHTINLVQLKNSDTIDNTTIEEFIREKFNSNSYVFYIFIEDKDTKQYDIEHSLITNSTFEGECTVCYKKTSLKHYYKCNLKNTTNHHGICADCCMSWHSANPDNKCPLCRSDKKN